MSSVWPWVAVAAAGALHGLNPATGWLFAAAHGVRSRDRRQALGALLPIAAGHAASVALVAAVAMLGMAMDRATLLALAGGLLALAALARLAAGHAALALWSCMMSTLHGAGLMLVPALVPLCLSGGPGREITASGSLALALAAVCVHTAAMLAMTALIASLCCCKFAQSFLSAARRVYGIVPFLSHLWLRKHAYPEDQRTPLVDDRLDHAGRGHQLPDTQHPGRLGADAAH
jgi:hypothetical protein